MKLSLHWIRVSSLAASLMLPACGDALEGTSNSGDNVGSAVAPIVNGSKVAACGFPNTVHLSMGCTGTLVHPQLVTTAAHCLEGEGGKTISIGFGDNEHSIAKEVRAKRCVANPRYDGSTGTDFAFCVLDQAIDDVPIAPVLMGCETEILEVGQEVVLAGFGMIGEREDNDGSKRAAFTKIDDIGSKAVSIGSDGKSACYGDSGGPAFVKLKDGSWRSFGITHGGELCGKPTEYALIHPAVGWIEQESGIDITPCHTASGEWSPSAKCTGFSTNLDVGTGSWDNWCNELATRSAPSATCGQPIDTGGTGGSGGDASTGGGGTAGASTGGAGTGGASTGGAGSSGAANGGVSTGGASTGGVSTAGVSTGGTNTAAGATNASANGGSAGTLGGSSNSAGTYSGGPSGSGGGPTTQYNANQDQACSCAVPGSSASRHEGGLGLAFLSLIWFRFQRRRGRWSSSTTSVGNYWVTQWEGGVTPSDGAQSHHRSRCVHPVP